jgi:hypothetical protein
MVRIRNGFDKDGEALMTTASSPMKPVRRFKALQDGPDRTAQPGFLMMVAGAVADLRNPTNISGRLSRTEAVMQRQPVRCTAG